MKKFFAFLVAIAAALGLASCGGGGSGYSSLPPNLKPSLRITPRPDSVRLPAGTFSDFQVSQGILPYVVSINNEAVDALFAASSGDASTLRIFGNAPGTTTVWVHDSSVGQTLISGIGFDVTVTPPAAASSFTLTPATGTTLDNPNGAGGPKLTFAIADGTAPYAPTAAIGVAGAGYVTASVDGSTLTVTRDATCLNPGDPDMPVPVTVTDSTGATATVNVTLHYSAVSGVWCP